MLTTRSVVTLPIKTAKAVEIILSFGAAHVRSTCDAAQGRRRRRRRPVRAALSTGGAATCEDQYGACETKSDPACASAAVRGINNR